MPGVGIGWKSEPDLDGIPLAIELAAARVPALSVDQIAARLDDRFRLLTRGSRASLPRQQTLRAALDWSYQLLTEREQLELVGVRQDPGGHRFVINRPDYGFEQV